MTRDYSDVFVTHNCIDNIFIYFKSYVLVYIEGADGSPNGSLKSYKWIAFKTLGIRDPWLFAQMIWVTLFAEMIYNGTYNFIGFLQLYSCFFNVVLQSQLD